MQDHQIVVVPNVSQPLPPREQRSLIERIRAANGPWSVLMLDMASIHMSGTLAYLGLCAAMGELIHDPGVLDIVCAHFESAALNNGKKNLKDAPPCNPSP